MNSLQMLNGFNNHVGSNMKRLDKKVLNVGENLMFRHCHFILWSISGKCCIGYQKVKKPTKYFNFFLLFKNSIGKSCYVIRFRSKRHESNTVCAGGGTKSCWTFGRWTERRSSKDSFIQVINSMSRNFKNVAVCLLR